MNNVGKWCCICFLAVWLFSPLAAQAVTISTVPVGNPGNAGEVQSQGTFGAVAYDYRIGTTEVTNAQYAEFLNAKDATGVNSLALYDSRMTSDARGGINFAAGNPNGLKYSAKTDMGNKPVNYVSWHDSIRFANWLHNGQGTGGTETGAYTLLGGTPTPSNWLLITRNAGAVWFLTSEDEWYKAAYFDPSLASGSGDYWDYPTQSNTAPAVATANSVGDISSPGTNVANIDLGADWNSLDGNVTTVGSAGPLSESFYGTSDQGGNVWEWNETLSSAAVRGLRGGSWGSTSNVLLASIGFFANPPSETSDIGFRVATVPEPSLLVLAALGIVGLLGWRHRAIRVSRRTR
jgi:formylglycine-generating enzyme required for sulfatase activity